MRSIKDICFCEENGLCLDIHLPCCDEFPVFLYFHGGGLESGTKADQTEVFEYLTKNGIGVVSADYRMYPTAKFPEFLIDAAKATDWVFINIKNYGNVKKIFVGGSSAGGYISQMLCFDDKWLKKYGISPLQIDGFILDAGQPTSHFNVLREKGLDTRRVIIDETAPLYFVGLNEKYPPMFIIYSDNDMENRPEQTILLVSTLKHFGHTENVTVKEMHGTHCQYVFDKDENGDNIFAKIVLEYIRGI